jgi:hypothetical protein
MKHQKHPPKGNIVSGMNDLEANRPFNGTEGGRKIERFDRLTIKSV